MKQIFQNFLNTLKRYKVSSVLNIAGLSIALTALYFLVAQVRYDVTYNRAIENHKDIYQVFLPTWNDSTKIMSFMPRVLMEEVAKCTPLIEEVVTVPAFSIDANFVSLSQVEAPSFALKYAMGGANRNTFEMLGYNIIDGTLQDFDNDTGYTMAAISHSAAAKRGVKVGDEISMVGTEGAAITVVAIFEDRVANTSFASVDIYTNTGKDLDPTLNRWNNAYFVKAAKGVTSEQLNSSAQEAISTALVARFSDYFDNTDEQILYTTFIPISKTYFDERIMDFGSSRERGDKTYTIMLISVALIIIVIALLNFVNFFFALMPVRIRTINLCKIYGSSNGALRANFIFETLFMILLSLVLSLGVIFILVDVNIGTYFIVPVALAHNWGVVGIVTLCALAISILISLYPSYKITSYPATLSIKGNFGATKQGKTLRYGLLALQLIVSITLICVVALFNLQLSFVKSKDLGFNEDNMIVIDTSQALTKKAANENLCARIMSISGVDDTTSASYPIVQERFGQNGQLINGIEGFVNVIYVAPNFFDFMGIEIIDGRELFASDELYNSELEIDRCKAVFNETAAKYYNVTLKSDILERGAFEVVGISKDINNFSLDKEIAPMAYASMRGDIGWSRYNYIRYEKGADVDAIVAEVRNIICELDPNVSLGTIDVQTFEDSLEQVYSTQSDLVNKIALFTLISIVISLMGIFGLVYFDIQHKRREIAIRRVLGASITSILIGINVTYLKITTACFVVATPIGYYIANRYLSTFAYRTPIYWWVFALVFMLVALLITSIITISSYRTANINPREAINKNN